MTKINALAYFGGAPRLKKPVHVAQMNLPPWQKVKKAIRKIFERKHFTNHGPLEREFESKFSTYLGTKNAVCFANGTMALMAMYKALDLKGEVVVPAYTFPATVQALSWAGVKPVLCDVDPKTQMPSASHIQDCLTQKTTGVILTHVWGRCAGTHEIENLVKSKGLKLGFDACHGIGCSYRGKKIGNFGNAETFSFHATKILNASEGGCVVTNDSDLAATLRAIRSFHLSNKWSFGKLRMNGKMSEAQAALALLSLEQLERNKSANRMRHTNYKRLLSGMPGIQFVNYNNQNNHQYVNILIEPNEMGLCRDEVFNLLKAENIICRRHFMPGMHRTPPYNADYLNIKKSFSGTDWLCQRILQLPNGQDITKLDILKICEVLREIYLLGPNIRKKLK